MRLLSLRTLSRRNRVRRFMTIPAVESASSRSDIPTPCGYAANWLSISLNSGSAICFGKTPDVTKTLS